MGAMKDISLAIDEALGMCDGPRWHIAYWCCPKNKYSEHWQAFDQITGRRYDLPVCTTRATDDTLVEWVCKVTGEHIENDCYSVYVDRNSAAYVRSSRMITGRNDMSTINIYRDDVWAGTGTIDSDGEIRDCPAVLGRDQDDSDVTYELIMSAISEGLDSVDRPDGEYTWVIEE